MDVKKEIQLQDKFDQLLGPIRDNGDNQQVWIVGVDFLQYREPGCCPRRGEIVEEKIDGRKAENGKKFFFCTVVYTMKGTVAFDMVAQKVCLFEVIARKKYSDGCLHVFFFQ